MKSIIALLLLASLAGCKQPLRKTTAAAPRNMLQARVFTVQTTIEPGEKKFNTEVVVVGSKVRLTDELDRWRLFDLEKNEVVMVDELAKNYRPRTFASLVAEKRAMLRIPTPATVPQMTARNSGRTQQIAGVEGREWVIEFGGYRRELWLSTTPLVGERFWPLFIGSEPLGGSHPARGAAVHLQLMNEHGFPLLDEIEVRYGTTDMRTRRVLIKSEQKPVPAALLEIPRDFVDATVKAPAAGRPGASSSPAGRNTPAAESQSFSRSRTAP
jgi:hypothetical protein